MEGRLYADENDASCAIAFTSTTETELAAGSVIQNPESVAEQGVIKWETLSIR